MKIDNPSRVKPPVHPVWKDPIEVKYSQIDINHHINNTRYLEWVLNEIPFAYLQSHLVREMEVNFLTEGHIGDTVRVGIEQKNETDWIACIERVGDQQLLYTVRFKFEEA